MEESGHRPVSSITLASPILRSLTVLYILALLATGIAYPPLVLRLFLLCNDYVISVMIISVIAFTIERLVFENRSTLQKICKNTGFH